MVDLSVYVGYQMVSDRDIPCAIFLAEVDALMFVEEFKEERYYQRLEADIDVMAAWMFLTRHPSLELTQDKESNIFSIIEGGLSKP